MRTDKEKVGKRENIQDTGINKLLHESVASEPEKYMRRCCGEIVNYNYILKEHAHSKATLAYKTNGIREITLSDYLTDVKTIVVKLIRRSISDRAVKSYD